MLPHMRACVHPAQMGSLSAITLLFVVPFFPFFVTFSLLGVFFISPLLLLSSTELRLYDRPVPPPPPPSSFFLSVSAYIHFSCRVCIFFFGCCAALSLSFVCVAAHTLTLIRADQHRSREEDWRTFFDSLLLQYLEVQFARHARFSVSPLLPLHTVDDALPVESDRLSPLWLSQSVFLSWAWPALKRPFIETRRDDSAPRL